MEQINNVKRSFTGWTVFISLGLLIFMTGMYFPGMFSMPNIVQNEQGVSEELIETEETCEDQVFCGPELFGFNTGIFQLYEARIKPNQVLGNLFLEYGLPGKAVKIIVEKARDVFNIRQIRPGKRFAFVHSDPCQKPDFFIYEPDPYRYVLFQTAPPYDVKVVDRPIETKVESFSGVIESSLWNAMRNEGMSISLIDKMEDALAWSVDFYSIQKGDAFKLLFERKYIDGEPVGIGQLLGAYFTSGGREFQAVYYENDAYKGYYDLQGRATKRAFLKTPVKYSRISSGYTMKRFHPVLKRYKAHLGTDYAAPSGTKIYAVADGTISRASYTRGNGNYVKIRHNRTYETQYLHMRGFAKGIRPGRKVRQGDVIGYVGQTGLATGPHVCFRFWKNGRQVDHRRLNFPPPKPLPESELAVFYAHRDQIIAQLDQVPLPNEAMLASGTEQGNKHLPLIESAP